MITERSIDIDAPAAVVWDVFADVEQWPAMTPSIRRVTALDGPELAVGRRYRIEQPRFPALVWEVTDLAPGRAWTWVQRSPGGTTTAEHEVLETGATSTTVRQRIDQGGPIGTLVGLLTRGLTPRYMDQEAQGLKARSEARWAEDAATT
jgi:uncharacterized membrane protein